MATPKDANDITRLLIEGRAGDLQSRDQAISLLYDNLHQIARQLLRRERGTLTLSAPELIHEVFFRLFGKNEPDWESRRHFTRDCRDRDRGNDHQRGCGGQGKPVALHESCVRGSEKECPHADPPRIAVAPSVLRRPGAFLITSARVVAAYEQ